MLRERFEAGQRIFTQNEPSDSAYLVVSGHVNVVSEDGGQEVHLAKLAAGEVFGEMGLVGDQPRSASAIAGEPTVVMRVDATEFNRLLEDQPEEVMDYLRALIERLREMNDRLVAMEATAKPAGRSFFKS